LVPFSFKTQFFFQVQGTEINVEVSSSHVFGSNIENHLSSGENLMKLKIKTPMITMLWNF